MDIVRYTYVRQRLIDLYRELSYEGFRMFVPGQMFMNKNQLKEHEYISYQGSYGWGDDIHSHRPYLITVPMLKDLIKGINKESTIGFYDADDSIRLFKLITEYLDLWMDIANDAPQYYIPHVPELYELEEVALWIFHVYKPTMIHKANMKLAKRREEEKDNPDVNPFLLLIRMGASESVDEIPDEVSFSSILDDRLPSRLRDYYTSVRKSKVAIDVEEEWRINMADIADLID